MAIHKNGETTHIGEVVNIRSHMWLDGMEDVFAVVWNMDTHSTEDIQVGYYGSDGHNLMGDSYAKIDISEEVKADILHTLRERARKAFADSVTHYKNSIHKDSNVIVVRGKKVPKGTELKVFWVGEKETYRARMYSYINETEEIAGCLDKDGNKVWVKTEYLKVTDKLKSPNRHERKKFIQAYIEKERREYNV